MSCAQCGHRSPLVIDITVPKQDIAVRLVTCTRCETRTWRDGQGHDVPRPALLRGFSGRSDFELTVKAKQGTPRMSSARPVSAPTAGRR